VKILTWVWQAGGTASRAGAVVGPDDVKGLTVRGGSRAMDLMLKAAGGIISSVPSNAIRAAMESGSLDAAVTSSTSLISFRLETVSKNLTTGRGKSFWFMLEPLLMSKAVFDGLSKEQQKAVTEIGEQLEAFALDSAKQDDQQVAEIYKKAGAGIHDMDEAILAKWRGIAQDAAWKDYANRNAGCARFLKLAESVTA
jgi:TRAP-type C4-dicarboxylate transport system substrate-binding protein